MILLMVRNLSILSSNSNKRKTLLKNNKIHKIIEYSTLPII